MARSVALVTFHDLSLLDSLRGSSVINIWTRQRISTWPLRRDEKRNSRSVLKLLSVTSSLQYSEFEMHADISPQSHWRSASLLRNKGQASANVGIALSATEAMHFCGAGGGRGRELLLNIMALEMVSGRVVTRFRLRYSTVDVLLIPALPAQPLSARATSLEVAGATPLPNKLLSIPMRVRIAAPLPLNFWIFNMFHKGALVFDRPSPPASIAQAETGLVSTGMSSGCLLLAHTMRTWKLAMHRQWKYIGARATCPPARTQLKFSLRAFPIIQFQVCFRARLRFTQACKSNSNFPSQK